MFSYFHNHRWWQRHNQHPLRSSLGGILGIAISAKIGMMVSALFGDVGWLVAPIGASAVLVFAVPASPLAQPRAVLLGNVASALVGMVIGRGIGSPYTGAALAVGLAILVMHLLRCIHPPGGAMALVAVMQSQGASPLPWHFILAPVAVNTAALIAAGWLFNNLTGSRYPHRAERLPEHRLPVGIDYDRADLEAVLDELEDAPDVTVDDLDAIFRAVQIRRQSHRSQGSA
jgi:CBS domain-containing membrane protein